MKAVNNAALSENITGSSRVGHSGNHADRRNAPLYLPLS
jgi:hypothetical protein